MGGVYLESRLDFLRAAQNQDGGWGYFPGKQSWLEPTAYAMLALEGTPGSAGALDRAWHLLQSWQLPDGSVRPAGDIAGGTWVTALFVLLGCVRGVPQASVGRAVEALLQVVGAEHNLAMRAFSYFNLLKTKLDVSHEGWPWRKGNAAWIEPTALTLVALKKAARQYGSAQLNGRVREGEALVLSRRCSDGGWNSGNPNVLNYDLPSYPESTGLALLGLQGRTASELAGPLQVARRFRLETKSSLAKAWLAIALRCHGENPGPAPDDARASSDLMLAALETLGHPQGNYRLLETGERA
ncbi:MAG TPA: prenyltransferase/squalene oxidase repeat-containing protein [Bryobacteraceae bacterium]